MWVTGVCRTGKWRTIKKRGGICRTGKWRTKSQGWKMTDWIMTDWKMMELNKSKRIYCVRRKTLMCTTCNCFKHKSNYIYYTTFTVILIKNMINKRNHTMTTVRHVSQCSILRYSFSFNPGLVGASSRLQSDALCENAHHHADYSSAQWAVTTLVRYVVERTL